MPLPFSEGDAGAALWRLSYTRVRFAGCRIAG